MRGEALARTQANRGGGAFTLIELLVVVAILAILAAIAIPNLAEGKVRARLARVRAEQRALATALEAYYLDQSAYPSANSQGSMKWTFWLTTPLAYIHRADLADPFTGPEAVKGSADRNLSYPTYRFFGFNEMGFLNADSETGTVIRVYAPPGRLKVLFYCLFSHGPDRIRNKALNGKTFIDDANLFVPAKFVDLLYDPSNGAMSQGEILRPGGQILGRAAPAMRLVRP